MRVNICKSTVFVFLGVLKLGVVDAANTANATVTFTIGSINEISVSGNPSSLTVNSATAGSQPTSATDNATTYNITTNGSSLAITGAIDSSMPTGVTLSVELAAPTGGTSSGAVNMTTVAQNLVTGISNVAESGLTITYTVAATASASVQGPLNRTVTYTLGP